VIVDDAGLCELRERERVEREQELDVIRQALAGVVAGAAATTKTADIAATADKPFAGTPSTAKDIAKVVLAMGLLDVGWKKAEPKLIDAGVYTNHSTFGRAKDRLRSSQR
jgi:hypothetical protein